MSLIEQRPVQALTRKPPPFFDQVYRNAQRRWAQLDADPELAGPWRQLFLQVQSPRHVVSELLQNADDAGATMASARIENGFFLFEHNGIDFDAEQFASLCRFGFSNKRRLHTIGFRGIGFKSTFSLGQTVEVWTPTLAVRFNHNRFTQPEWAAEAPLTKLTTIRVRIDDADRKKALQRNLDEWAGSPASLLFFQNIRSLTVSGKRIEQEPLGAGPVPNSFVIRLSGQDQRRILLVRSAEEPFPDDAIDEIRRERIAGDGDFSLPPCRVELVLGLGIEQRLYVVLPTDVRPLLPFSANAPFVQDPARTGLKDPASSPTNQWLFKRLGNLAVRTLQSWLENDALPISERAKAYALLPNRPEDSGTIAGACQQQVVDAFTAGMVTNPLLTTDGTLVNKDQCIAPPLEVYGAWTPSQLALMFGSAEHRVLAAEIALANRNLLVEWELLNLTSRSKVLEVLETSNTILKPANWQALCVLWAFVQEAVQYDYQGQKRRKLKIVPVEGHPVLVSSQLAVRLSAKTQLNDADWEFINTRIRVLDRQFLVFLNPPESRKDSDDDPKSPRNVAKDLLEEIGLDSPTSPDMLVMRAYHHLLAQETKLVADLVRLTHIIANLDASVPAGFQYVTRDGSLRPVSLGLSQDLESVLEPLLPAEQIKERLLHEDYTGEFVSCTRQRWFDWVGSEKSGLRTFVGIVPRTHFIYGRENLADFIAERRGVSPESFHLKTMSFRVESHDFDPRLFSHWTKLASTDDQIWCKIVGLIAVDPTASWMDSRHVRITQPGSAYDYPIKCGDLPAEWIRRLRGLPCLQDIHGFLHQPAELLRRTPLTDSFRDVEPFVQAEMDTPATQELLNLLGVRDTPTGLEKLTDRLKDLATVENPPVQEVMKWYGRLDQVLLRCSSSELESARTMFSSERLILTSDGSWVTSGEVFQSADEQDVPDAPIVHAQVRHLSMWTRLGVAERPSLDLTIDWLKTLESGSQLDAQNMKRVRGILARAPLRVWIECSHWLSLDGNWTPTSEFGFRLTMQGLTKWGDLFPYVKTRTANLQMLSVDVCEQPPFSTLPNLAGCVEYRLTERESNPPPAFCQHWLLALAQGLRRVKLKDEDQTLRLWEVAERLSRTIWQPFRMIRVTPFVDGTPAGQSHAPQVLWDENTLYVQDGPLTKLYKPLVDELARPFGLNEITEAVRACIDRADAWIEDYLTATFELMPAPAKPALVLDKPVDPEGGLPESAESKDSESTAASQPAGVAEAEDGEAETDENEEDKLGEAVENIEAAGEKEVDTTDHEPSPPTRDRKPRENPTLISQYARLKGYSWSEARNRYIHPDGSWIEKADGTFNWQKFGADGVINCRYWVSEQCLMNGGIELAAELWELIKRYSSATGLILKAEDGRPQEFNGGNLVRMVEGDSLCLYPAKYRLKKSSE